MPSRAGFYAVAEDFGRLGRRGKPRVLGQSMKSSGLTLNRAESFRR